MYYCLSIASGGDDGDGGFNDIGAGFIDAGAGFIDADACFSSGAESVPVEVVDAVRVESYFRHVGVECDSRMFRHLRHVKIIQTWTKII